MKCLIEKKVILTSLNKLKLKFLPKALQQRNDKLNIKASLKEESAAIAKE